MHKSCSYYEWLGFGHTGHTCVRTVRVPYTRAVSDDVVESPPLLASSVQLIRSSTFCINISDPLRTRKREGGHTHTCKGTKKQEQKRTYHSYSLIGVPIPCIPHTVTTIKSIIFSVNNISNTPHTTTFIFFRPRCS